jgi:protein-L-isoaspartate O-methyltransferase
MAKPAARWVRACRSAAADLAWTAAEGLVRSRQARRIYYAVRNRQLFADLSQHDRMLADSVRIEAYYAALQKHVKPGDVVIDLGTGSGVLAFFASRLGARRVHAIEHGPVIEAADAVARDNGLDNITFHHVHSRSFDVPERVDVIVHEQIGESLFDEAVVENVADLRDRLLKTGGVILPAKLHLYVEPAELQDDARFPFAWQQELHGVSFRALRRFADAQHYLYRQPVLRPFPLKRFLCRPEPVFSVDLHETLPGDLPNELHYAREAVVGGRLDGMCVYFEVGFDDELRFGSSPSDRGTNWGSPLLRVESRRVEEGDMIELNLKARDLATPRTWEWSVDVRPGGGTGTPSSEQVSSQRRAAG